MPAARGRLADLVGRCRVVFLIGLGVFALGSAVDGLAVSPGQLVTARAVQGLGAALLSPAALSLLTTTFPPGPARHRALARWSAAGASGGAAGMLLGGVLTATVGWRSIFWINVPLVVVAAAVGRVVLVKHRPLAAGSIDVSGALTITAGLFLLVDTLVEGPTRGWPTPATLARLAGAATLIATFVVVERYARAPLVPFGAIGRRSLSGANLTVLAFFAGMAALFFFISLYLQQVLGYGPLAAGLAQLPLALGIIASSRATPRAMTRYGLRAVLLGGLALVAAALIWSAAESRRRATTPAKSSVPRWWPRPVPGWHSSPSPSWRWATGASTTSGSPVD